jgi:hypothetical protein
MAALISHRWMVAAYQSRRSAMYTPTLFGSVKKLSRATESFALSIRRSLFTDDKDDNSLGIGKLNRRCDGSDIEAAKDAI